MAYEKHPTFACEPCRKTFKNKRALAAHNKNVHRVDDIPVPSILATERSDDIDFNDADDSGDSVCIVYPHNS